MAEFSLNAAVISLAICLPLFQQPQLQQPQELHCNIDPVISIAAHINQKEQGICAISFDSARQTLYSAGIDRTVRKWELPSGTQVGSSINAWNIRPHRVQIAPNNSYAVAFAGPLELTKGGLILNQDHSLHVASLKPPLMTYKLDGHESQILAATISHNSELVASMSANGRLIIWDIGEKKIVRKTELQSGSVVSLAFSPDGKSLAGGTNDGSIYFWRIEDLKLVWSLRVHECEVLSLSILDDHIFCGGFNGSIVKYNVKNQTKVATFQANGGRVLSLKISSDNRLLLSGSGTRTSRNERIDCSAKLWNISDAKSIQTFGNNRSWVNHAIFIDKNRMATADSGGYIKIWEMFSDDRPVPD